MDDKDDVVQRLTTQLNLAARLRASARANPQTADCRQSLRTWQADRLARTHADLLASARFGPAAAFFLTNEAGCLQAIHFGHLNVHEDDIEPLPQIALMRFFAVGGQRHGTECRHG